MDTSFSENFISHACERHDGENDTAGFEQNESDIARSPANSVR